MSELTQTILITYFIINVFMMFYILGICFKNNDTKNLKDIRISRLDILIMILFLPATILMIVCGILCYLILIIKNTKISEWLTDDIKFKNSKNSISRMGL